MLAGLTAVSCYAVNIRAKDLDPVTFEPTPSNPPIVLAKDGKALATIAVMGDAGSAPALLQKIIKEATGAELPIMQGKIQPPAIVIGNCDPAIQHGLDGGNMPPEGFAIKTAPGLVFIVGNGQGTEWGCYDFLERFAGMRWHFPSDLGQSIPKTKTLTIPPVWLEDAPVFRKREIWPPISDSWNGTGTNLQPLQTFLRGGNSWPINVMVHQPNWSGVQDYVKNRPEVFQLRSDGTRDTTMLNYGDPETLKTYLENLQLAFEGKEHPPLPIDGNAITVSPNDADIACYCKGCRALWDPNGGTYGSASRIMATFVNNLALAVKKRWPDKTIIFLPYVNYSQAPNGYKFSGNVEVQLCGMPGMAMFKEPSVYASEQDDMDKWVKITGRKIQLWEYDIWPANRTSAPLQYPHVVKEFYEANRDKTIGTFINGDGDNWLRQNITLYCWMKVLWNPDFNVDAALNEFCNRMFGPASKTMRELLQIQMDGWEKSHWPGAKLSAKAIFEISYPRNTVLHMQALVNKAREQAEGDKLATQRIEYYLAPFAEFFKDAKNYSEGNGLRPLIAQQVGEDPELDGTLDDPVWKRAQPVSFVSAYDKTNKEPTYPTTVQAVWTPDGVTFGFRMTEPTPQYLTMGRRTYDDPSLWWDDNVELLFDVTGQNTGEFYHFIVTPRGTVADAKGSDFSWNTDKVKFATCIGKDDWSLQA